MVGVGGGRDMGRQKNSFMLIYMDWELWCLVSEVILVLVVRVEGNKFR